MEGEKKAVPCAAFLTKHEDCREEAELGLDSLSVGRV